MEVILRVDLKTYEYFFLMIEALALEEQDEPDFEPRLVKHTGPVPYGVGSVMASAPWRYGYVATSYGAMHTTDSRDTYGAYYGPVGYFVFYSGTREAIGGFVSLLEACGQNILELPVAAYSEERSGCAWYVSKIEEAI